jgi:hypothetical protein
MRRRETGWVMGNDWEKGNMRDYQFQVQYTLDSELAGQPVLGNAYSVDIPHLA